MFPAIFKTSTCNELSIPDVNDAQIIKDTQNIKKKKKQKQNQITKNIQNRLNGKKNTINIAILGPVSAGKSTFMNTLFVNQFSDMKIKRTTMTPQIYVESENLTLSVEDINKIKNQNREINELIIKKTEKNEEITYEEISKDIVYEVPRVHDLVSLKDNVYLKIYDIPGLNDARTQELYFEYINKNFHEWDIVIMVVDINSAMNTDGEVKILKNIVDNCKNNLDKYGIQNKLFVLANKVDDLEHCPKWGLRISDEEYTEMYEQIKKQVKDVVDSKYSNLEYHIMPLSAEDAFIYRMYSVNSNVKLDIKHINKFGHNEFGKSTWNRFSIDEKHVKVRELMKVMNISDSLQLTGFNYFKEKLNLVLDLNNQYVFLINHLMYECSQLIVNYNKEITLIGFNDNLVVSENNRINYNVYNSKINETILKFHDIYNVILYLNDVFEVSENTITYKDVVKSISTNTKNKIQNGVNRFYKFLNEFIDLSKNKLILYEELEDIKEDDIEYLEKSKLFCNEWDLAFGDNFTKFKEILEILKNGLNNYYVLNINEKKISVDTLMTRITRLFKNSFVITKDLLLNFFSNDNMLNKQPLEIIKYFEELEDMNILTKNQKKEMMFSLLHKIYRLLNENKLTVKYMQDGRNEYVYFANLFWSNIIYSYNIKNSNFQTLGFMINSASNKVDYYTKQFDESYKCNYNLNDLLSFKDIISLETYYVSLF